MTEKEARDALFQLHFDYMMNPPNKRLELYDEYQRKRSEIKAQLVKLIRETKEK